MKSLPSGWHLHHKILPWLLRQRNLMLALKSAQCNDKISAEGTLQTISWAKIPAKFREGKKGQTTPNWLGVRSLGGWFVGSLNGESFCGCPVYVTTPAPLHRRLPLAPSSNVMGSAQYYPGMSWVKRPKKQGSSIKPVICPLAR